MNITLINDTLKQIIDKTNGTQICPKIKVGQKVGHFLGHTTSTKNVLLLLSIYIQNPHKF